MAAGYPPEAPAAGLSLSVDTESCPAWFTIYTEAVDPNRIPGALRSSALRDPCAFLGNLAVSLTRNLEVLERMLQVMERKN